MSQSIENIMKEVTALKERADTLIKLYNDSKSMMSNSDFADCYDTAKRLMRTAIAIEDSYINVKLCDIKIALQVSSAGYDIGSFLRDQNLSLTQCHDVLQETTFNIKQLMIDTARSVSWQCDLQGLRGERAKESALLSNRKKELDIACKNVAILVDNLAFGYIPFEFESLPAAKNELIAYLYGVLMHLRYYAAILIVECDEETYVKNCDLQYFLDHDDLDEFSAECKQELHAYNCKLQSTLEVIAKMMTRMAHAEYRRNKPRYYTYLTCSEKNAAEVQMQI
jgi:hypothetical protein